MRCIIKKRLLSISIAVILVLSLTGCAGGEIPAAFSPDMPGMNFNINSELHEVSFVTPFAENLCVNEANVENEKIPDDPEVEAAGLFDLSSKETLYVKNAFTPMHPASLTKVMTALVALKDADTTELLTASSNVKINEKGAQLAKINEGDTMSLDQALHILLMYSANDVAVMIAEGVSGSVEAFCQRMNEEARALGATHTYFVNPNGLTGESHLTCAYDLYLIFNEAIKYDLFNEIISMSSYSTVYHTAEGTEKEFSCGNTNGYLSGTYATPPGITVIGGKTGTTAAAGHCLILYSKDTLGNPYISVVLSADSSDSLYRDMSNLLEAVY